MCYRNLGTQHTAYLLNLKKNTTSFLHKSRWMSTKKLVLFAGVTACRDVQSRVAQCLEIFNKRFSMLTGFWELEEARCISPKGQCHLYVCSF